MAIFSVLNSLLGATLLPLVAFFLLLFFGRRFGRQGRACGGISLGFAIGSFALALVALVRWVAANGDVPHYVEAFTYPWIMLPAPPADPFHPMPAQAITIGCLVDSLTVVMFVVLTLLGALAQLFAMGSVAAEKPRFFALFQLLHFAILAFFLSNSLLQMFIFWALLSLAAYALIRHATAESPRRAGLDVFLLHLLGDAAFLLGIGILVLNTRSFNGLALFDARGTSVLADTASQTLGVRPDEYISTPHTATAAQVPGVLTDPKRILVQPQYLTAPASSFLDMHWLTWVGICFFVAALTRMAQFPMLAWPARAAEAPAPVTAVLLGGVFLAAGAYLLARVFVLMTLDVRLIAAVVGSVTLCGACLVAIVQTDMRKTLAWLAVSHGGFVLLFLGTGGYTAGILHLVTQAFVKTALFLAAGSVLHGLGTADLRQMGGLWRRFPITAAASLICVLAAAGAPWLSSTYSTNTGMVAVLDYAQALRGTSGNDLFIWLLFRTPIAVTYLASFAIGRWWWLIFAGPNRNAKLLDAASESAFLTLPVIILAVFSIGYWFEFARMPELITRSIPAVMLPADGPALVIQQNDLAADAGFPHVIRATGWSFLGLAAAVAIYFNGLGFATRLRRLPGLNIVDYWLRQGMFLDELFEALLHLLGPLAWSVRRLEKLFVGILRLVLFILSLPVLLISLVERPRPSPPAPPAAPASESQ
jgi:NADH-quinone oxidoreductase subunit L